MLQELLNHDFMEIRGFLFNISFFWFLVLLAMLIDLFVGLHKAKQLDEIRTSEGYKRSVNKFISYYAMMFFAMIFDLIAPYTMLFDIPFSIVPYITVLCSLALIITEVKSVREKADKKLRRQTANSFRDIVSTLRNHQSALQRLEEYLKAHSNEKDD